MASTDFAPHLAPPGAGVPFWQRRFGRHVLLPLYARRLTWDRVPELLEAQGRTLTGLAGEPDAERLSRRVLVPRQIGLEDSSRWHSCAMVLDHLAIVGTRVAGIVHDLTHSRSPVQAVRTAALKPAPDLPFAEAARRYAVMLAEFRTRTIDQAGDRGTSMRFEHPWFGPLPAFRWMCFAPFHQAIHLRQVRRILARLGDPARG
jgi:hypothetical protein